ncbi:MAG: phenylacetate--CoA ligase family protein, partial [Deltaproteobacteria bacterium]
MTEFLPGIYDLPEKEIARIQSELLVEAVDRAVRTSPYYRERAAKAVRPGSVAELAGLPLTTKRDIQARNRDFWAAAPERIREVVATTGTTGTPVYVPMADGDIERLAENERRGFSWMGARPGDLFHVAVTLDNLFVAGMAYHLGLRKIGAAAVRVGAQPARRHLDLMRQLCPAGVVAVPSLLLALARQARNDGDDLGSFAPRRALLIGDAIRDRDLRSNTLGRLLEEQWGGELFSTY